MIPRGKIDITYTAIFAGLYYCFSDLFKKKENITGDDEKLICLSVRTGFDLLLSTLNFPAGSEILVTDINIPDMFNIITSHQLIPVPLIVDKHTLNVDPGQIEGAITPNTRAILITHLFGGIMEIDEILSISRKNKLFVIEDCAQAYAGNYYNGNPMSDVAMFSFGFIKTNTSLSGALIKVRDPSMLNKMRQLELQLPQQKKNIFLKKLWKGMFVKLLTSTIIYGLFYRIILFTGKDFDKILSGFTRGFSGDDILTKIRYRPSIPNVRLLKKRLKDFSAETIVSRKRFAVDILNHTSTVIKIGDLNKNNSYWVLPIEVAVPNKIIDRLRRNGFDATNKASSLVKLPSPSSSANNELLLDNLVYLPMYPAMTKRKRYKLSQIINA